MGSSNNSVIEVSNAQEFTAALESDATEIKVTGTISSMPSQTLPAGKSITGGELHFGGPGLVLTANNTLKDISITTADTEIAISNASDIADAGTLSLNNVKTQGQVYLAAADKTRQIHVEIDGLHVVSADVRGRTTRPHGFGVDVLQGGLTLFNHQGADSSFTTTIKNVAIGSADNPIKGSGVFLAGKADREANTTGGIVSADLVHTLDIHTNGGIATGTPDVISGGVFVVSAAVVKKVHNEGLTTTYGQNDMVLDNWGTVDTWLATGEVHSYGPSGIGFVNFGGIRNLEITGKIITEGPGARGFNLYDGTLEQARFTSIETTGDGSIGIQISKPMGSLTVNGDVKTTGGEGMSLVKGVQTPLKAIAVSIKPGAEIRELNIGGSLITEGDGVITFENAGTVAAINIAGEIIARGKNSATTA